MRNSRRIKSFRIRKNRCRCVCVLFFVVFVICTIFLVNFSKPVRNSFGRDWVSFTMNHRNFTMINMKEIRAYVMKCPIIEATNRVEDAMAIIIINSHVCNIERRKLYRKAVSDAEVKKLGMRRIFLLGTISRQQHHHCNITQKEIEEEQRLHGDLLQGSMEDIHGNVELKDLMGLDFAARVGLGFVYIVHMNDNVLIDVYGLQKFLWQYVTANVDEVARADFLMGFVHPEDLFDEALEDFENNITDERPNIFDYSYYAYQDVKPQGFPKYLESYFYVTNYRTAAALVWQAQAVPPYLETSIWITGMISDTLNIPLKALPTITAGSFEEIEKCLRIFEQYSLNCPHLVHRCESRQELHKLLQFQRNGKECFGGHCKPDNWYQRFKVQVNEWLSGSLNNNNVWVLPNPS